MGIAYAGAAWVLLQSLDVVAPLLDLPDSAAKIAFTLLAIGFVPAMIFAWAFEITPEGLKPAKQVSREESITAVTGRKLDLTIIAVLSVAVVLLLADRFIGQTPPDAEQTSEKSIAVLPFVNMSSDSEQEFFSDGITEEILNALAAVKELKVAGRTSSFAFKGQNQDLREIGETLGVEHILEGSVRKAGTKIRITAQLIQVDDGFHMWSDTYDRELTDVFEIQDEIANEILGQLRTRLLDGDTGVVAAQRTSPDVYERYLLAKQRIYERTGPAIDSAILLLDEAIKADPNYAPIYAQRGIATSLLSVRQYGSIPELEASRRGRTYIDKALELDPELAEGWAGLGLSLMVVPGETEAAIAALTRALELNPNLINASNWLYNTLQNTGEARAALQLGEELLERDPLYKPALWNMVFMYNTLGRSDDAAGLIDGFAKVNPYDIQLVRSRAIHAFLNGHVADAYPMAMQAYEQAPEDGSAHAVFSFLLGSLLEYERLANEGMDNFRVVALDQQGRDDEAYALAHDLALRGFPDELFRFYNRAGRSKELIDYVEERWPSLDSLASDYPRSVFGWDTMNEIALAYSRTGPAERFDQALSMLGSAIEQQTAQGVTSRLLLVNAARYYSLAGDYEAAIESLSSAVETGLHGDYLMPGIEPSLDPLRDDPRYEALVSTVFENINTDRLAVGLAPVDPETLY